jgi:collagen type VI alpha
VIIDAGDYQDAEEDLGRAVDDFPRDESRPGRAGFRLPLPGDDFAVIIEAGDEVDFGRASADIPRDNSGSGRAGFRLPLPEDGFADDFVVVEAGAVDDSKAVEDIPRDNSGTGRAGFRLPLPEEETDVVVIEAGEPAEGRLLVAAAKDKSSCNLPVRRSRCRALLQAFFFDEESGTCKKFSFGGCGETQAKRFSSKEECEAVCRAV